jgi:hypothetical protein
MQKGSLPPDGVLVQAQAHLDEASTSFHQARFFLSFAEAIPIADRPIKALRHGIEAARAETTAAVLTEQILSMTIGKGADQASSGGVSASPSPLLSQKGVRVGVLTLVAEDLVRVRSALAAGDRAIQEIPSVPFLSSIDALKAEALDLSTRALFQTTRASTGLRVLLALLAPGDSALYGVFVERGPSPRSEVIGCSLLRVSSGALSLNPTCPALDEGDAGSAGDHAAFARRVYGVWEKHLAQPIAGVLTFDVKGLSEVLRGEPPIRVASYPYPIYAQDLPDLVSRAERGDLEVTDVEAFEQDVANAAFELLRRPRVADALARSLGTVLANDHLRIWMVDPSIEGLVHQMGWS